jgi:hypothetical protein
MKSPLIQARIARNVWKKKQELIQAHRRGLILGAKRAAKVAREMIECGWTDMEKFEAEVWDRVRTNRANLIPERNRRKKPAAAKKR